MESDEYASEDARKKRGREREEHDTIFQRSKRTTRTPQEGKEKEDNLVAMMKELMKDVKEIKRNQEKYQEELNDLRKENEMLKEEKEKMKKQMNSMEVRINTVERKITKKNIVITGMKMPSEDKQDLRTGMKNFMKSNMDVEIEIKEVEKIGNTVFKIELESTRDKEEVMQNKSKLRLLKQRIYIDNEMTREEREIQKKLKQIGEEERKEGRAVRVGYQKITIEGKEYKWDKEKEELVEHRSAHRSRKAKNG